ncbi:MAG: cytochrome c [Fibrobacteria bacterium]
MKASRIPAWILTTLATVLILTAGALLAALSGIYNVAASKPHSAVFSRVVSMAMERSVAFHAPEISAPDLFDSTLLKHGAGHFKTMCIACHGAPGTEPSEIGKGLNPEAPELSEASSEWSDSELHWIIKNGVRMTGMPAFGKSHDDREIWSLVAFTRAMAGLSPDKYRQLLDTLQGEAHRAVGEPGEKPKAPVPWKRRSLF